MSKFKVGDRVRIVSGRAIWTTPFIGMCGVITSKFIGPPYEVDAWHLDISGDFNAWDHFDLEPLINPDEEAWQAFKSLHLKPDPALILAKEAA